MRKAALLATLFLATASARAEEVNYRALYARDAPGVVLIYGTEGNLGSIGSGSVVRRDGLVVTNAHVILNHRTGKPWRHLYVYLKPRRVTGAPKNDFSRQYDARWLMFNKDLDLALVQIVNPPDHLTVIPLSDDRNVAIGDPTAAIGHPEQGARWSLTTGRIGGSFRDFGGVKGKDCYQMETSVNRGNSGGPLLDGAGNMIGINTMVARRGAGGIAIEGVNFAIQSRVVRRWIEQNGEHIPDSGKLVALNNPSPRPGRVARARPPPLENDTSANQTSVASPAPDTVAYTAPRRQLEHQQHPLPIADELHIRWHSSEPVGKVLTPEDLTRRHAAAAMQELDQAVDHGPDDGRSDAR